MPKAIISDRGTNFTSKLFRYLCKKLKIDQRLTTVYNPAGNGETERFNRTLTVMLRKELKDGEHANWENMLEDVLFAYRSSVHSSTLETPYYLLHGNLADRLRYSFQRVREESEKARNRHFEILRLKIVHPLKTHRILKIDSANRLQLRLPIFSKMKSAPTLTTQTIPLTVTPSDLTLIFRLKKLISES
ncbi:Uncharacterized protein APZ42_007392 [Daphnia magna]|uniref:Integrase catalytic domain-containing protein n=1 Tax=Daphnia magna TaxID=35525 RepID=A0A164FBH2_9CRUS|nr:Uncharacterized protein APZ42_007392 [Daphnia magna]